MRWRKPPAPRGYREWFGILSPDPPPARHDWPELLEMAQTMLDSRCKRYPGEVDGGRMDAGLAAREIRTFEAIVADWTFIVHGTGEPAGEDTLEARREALDSSIVTIAMIAREQHGFSPKLEDQADRVIALRWHLLPGMRTAALARLNHEIRAERRIREGQAHAA